MSENIKSFHPENDMNDKEIIKIDSEKVVEDANDIIIEKKDREEKIIDNANQIVHNKLDNDDKVISEAEDIILDRIDNEFNKEKERKQNENLDVDKRTKIENFKEDFQKQEINNN